MKKFRQTNDCHSELIIQMIMQKRIHAGRRYAKACVNLTISNMTIFNQCWKKALINVMFYWNHIFWNIINSSCYADSAAIDITSGNCYLFECIFVYDFYVIHIQPYCCLNWNKKKPTKLNWRENRINSRNFVKLKIKLTKKNCGRQQM